VLSKIDVINIEYENDIMDFFNKNIFNV
jgi:hypothetical protein